MIIKNFELQKIKSKDHKFFLFYGVNEGLKIEIIKKIFLENFDGEILYYETKIKKNLNFGETLFLPAEIELIKLKGKKTKILHIHM